MAKAKEAQSEFDPSAAGAGQSFEGSDTSVMVDMSGVEEASFEAIPKGIYEGVIEQCTYGLSQSSGQPMWSMQITITGGEYEGRKIFDNVSFSPKALPFAKKTLAVIAPELLTGPFNPEETAPQIEGRAVKVRTKLTKYEGEDQTRIKDYLTPGDAFLGG